MLDPLILLSLLVFVATTTNLLLVGVIVAGLALERRELRRLRR